MERINLSDNHRRSVSSSIYIIEKLIIELERELVHSGDPVMSKLIIDKAEPEIQHYISVINKIKSYIHYLLNKYDLQLSSANVALTWHINVLKSRMWEILCDTTSKGLKGYGVFPKEYAKEFDDDIDKLQKLIASI